MKNRILYIDRLRFFAILNIILLHIIAIFRWKYLNNTPSYFILSFIDSFTRVGIPIFFMLTGALMFSKKDENYKDFIKNRVIKLIIAYFFFCIIYYLYNNYNNLSIYEFLRLSTSGNLEYHLWFMPVIILIYLFIPFIKKIAISLTDKELLLMTTLIFILGNCFIGIEEIFLRYNYYLLGNFTLPDLIVYTNYLFIGYYLSKNKIEVNKKLIGLSILSILIIPFLTVLVSNNKVNDVFLNSVSPLVVIPSILMFIIFKNSKLKEIKLDQIIRNNINNIFYVYLIHVLFIKIIIDKIPYINNEHSLIIDLLIIPLLFVVVSLLSFLSIKLYMYLKNIIIKNYKTITKVLLIIFNILFILVFSIVLINLFINPYHFIKINYLYLIICSIIYIGLFFTLFKYSNKLFNNKIVNIVLIILYIVLQIVVVNMFMVKPSWDFGEVYKIAVNFASSSKPIFGASYLYLCDNNIPISIILDILFKVAHLIGYNHYLSVGIFFNIVMVDISLIYTYLLINKIDNRYSKPFIIFSLFFTPLLFYLPIFYTDTITMPFIIIPLYYLYKYFNIKDNKIYILIAFILFGIGGVIKPTVLIPVIAVIVHIILFNKNKYLIPISIFIVLVPLLGYKLFLNHFFVTDYIKENSIPKSHYIMIGLEGNGGFSQEAFEYTTRIEDPEERDMLVRKRIHNRINEMKEDNLFIPFYNRKISYTWTDGTFFSLDLLNRYPIHPKYINNVNSTVNNNLYWTISNFEWIIIIVLWIIGIVFNKYLPDKIREYSYILSISIFGLFLFLLIWETRSRYLINYIPLFIVNSYIGLIALTNYLKIRGNTNEK